MSPFYSFTAESLNGELVSMKEYARKVVLVVNTASQCGFTPQYAGLETLYRTYKDHGLVILGFPCNQFGGQEPGGVREIAKTCHRQYGVTFPMFSKVEVNGPNAHPLFQWLTAAAPGLLGNAVKWNFTKFLIGRDGQAITRFAPITKPEAIADAIRERL